MPRQSIVKIKIELHVPYDRKVLSDGARAEAIVNQLRENLVAAPGIVMATFVPQITTTEDTGHAEPAALPPGVAASAQSRS